MPARNLDELFNDALERWPEEREAFLRQVCEDDEDLYTRISSLLALHDQLGSFMQAPILERARADPGSPGNAAGPAGPATVTEKLSADRFSPGQLLGDRYRMEALLGRGGMGEVWRAYDLKLRVDVALKCLHKNLFSTERGLEMLRHEVRSARNVVSPHVCRIFDLVAEDGQELVSMEYIDGRTLQALLREKAPLELREAGEIAAQLLAGLEAIHAADLVHRDVKPANVMITRAGRIVLMDFGLAKGQTDIKEGSIAGTPAYMAPEQARGAALDARADIFAAGVILAEMISPKDQASREALWAGVRETPAKVPDGAWENVLRKAVSWDAAQRYESAHRMARALEEVTLRAEGVEDRTPYPGLNSFTEKDAEYFFGREAEVEEVWHKLQRMQFSAIIGPSGVGKSSFLRAGLIPSMPDGWQAMVCAPGSSPFKAMARGLANEIAGDAEAVKQLLNLEEPGVAADLFHRWRRGHDEVLFVLDQFEELFTLNPPEVQARFAEVLAEIALESDVHVLLSMRDDFLFRCHAFEALKPIFSDLTPLDALTGSALRRALVQPALACGYRFEDDALVDEMVEEVSDERGALPLLAFAAARMWEHRERSSGTLTRRSYGRIGGVGGALAQHAEATLERIGTDRWDVVREIFRNLITSQGTRVARSTDELLSVFEDQDTAKAVLDQLVDARLLTSFELPGDDRNGEARHRIELIHESLLRSWPRLVRWQTQDADGAQLRDQLRQAARLWEERSRSEDLLWTGTAYKDFALWRERYPGGLSESEDRFAEAMESRDLRQRRRRRVAVTGTIVTLLAVLAVVGTLWQRADRAARISESRRLHMLAEEQIETDNTLALALATASLEQRDDPEVRRTALEAMWQAPTRFVLALEDTLKGATAVALSPDGQWLATIHGPGVFLWPRSGGEPRYLEPEPRSTAYLSSEVEFHPEGNLLVAKRLPYDSNDSESPVVWTLWSVPDGRRLHTWEFFAGGDYCGGFLRGNPPVLLVAQHEDPRMPWKWWRLRMDEKEPEELGRADTSTEMDRMFSVDAAGSYLLDWKGTGVYLFPLDSLETAPILVGHHEQDVFAVAFSHDEKLIASGDKNGSIRVWSRRPDGSHELTTTFQTANQTLRLVAFDRTRSRVRHWTTGALQIASFDLDFPQAQPTRLLPQMNWAGYPLAPPDDSWVIFPRFFDNTAGEVSFYSLAKRRPHVVDVLPETPRLFPGSMHAGGTMLVANAHAELWLCNVLGQGEKCRKLWRHPQARTFTSWVVDPTERYLLVDNWLGGGEAWLIPLDGGEPRALGGFKGRAVGGVALSSDGRKAAVGGSVGFVGPGRNLEDAVIRVWDLKSNEVQILESKGETGFFDIWFVPGNRLVSSGPDGLRLWDLATGEFEFLSEEAHYAPGNLDAEGRYLAVPTASGVAIWDLESRTQRTVAFPMEQARSMAMSADARFVVAGMAEGEVLVRFLDEDEPHLLLGHDGAVTAVWISPESDRIHTASMDGSVRIWEVPKGRPLQALPTKEFLDVLRAQTNLRIALDPDAEEGYRTVYDQFPGWEVAPTW